MPLHIALLRAINVGGRNLIGMSDLRDMLESLGFRGVRSLLQSGNLAFEGGRRAGSVLEGFLEAETKKRFDVTVDYFVRTAEDWAAIVARNPFPKEAELDPSHLLVMFLKNSPDAKKVESVQAAIRGPEEIRPGGKELYITYPAGIGESKLTTKLIENKLGTRGTGRNWNTILKLAAVTGPSSST